MKTPAVFHIPVRQRVGLLLAICGLSATLVSAQTILVDWQHLWYCMHPLNGVLPLGSGATEPNAGPVKWYAAEQEFTAGYQGPDFVCWPTGGGPGYECGEAWSPVGYGGMDYVNTAGAEFSGYTRVLTSPGGEKHGTSYYRTTFSLPADGHLYLNPVIRYLLDDGGWIYLDGTPLLRINMAADAADTYLADAVNVIETEHGIRRADLTLPTGSVTGGIQYPTRTVAGDAVILRRILRLSPGQHTLAVSNHNYRRTSADLSMALQLVCERFPDSDGDSMPDEWESAHGLAPESAADSNRDADGDGQSNLAEYIAGTDPQNSASRLAITQAALSGTGLNFTWSSVPGKLYGLQFSATGTAWTDVPMAFPAFSSPAKATSSGDIPRINFPPVPALLFRVRIFE